MRSTLLVFGTLLSLSACSIQDPEPADLEGDWKCASGSYQDICMKKPYCQDEKGERCSNLQFTKSTVKEYVSSAGSATAFPYTVDGDVITITYRPTVVGKMTIKKLTRSQLKVHLEVRDGDYNFIRDWELKR